MIDAETKLIFEKMDRQEELKSRLDLAIPDRLIVDQWKTYVFFLKKNQKLLQDALDKIERQNITHETLVTSEMEARFNLFNFYSCSYCIRQTMYEGKHFSKGADEFDRLITNWKNEKIPRIVIAIRNKYQHGSLMEHVLHYEHRTVHHAKGEGFSVGYSFEASTWGKVADEVTGADAKTYLKELLEANPRDPVMKINFEFIKSCEQISERFQELFDQVFATELVNKKQVKDEYDEIEKWFQDRGMYTV